MPSLFSSLTINKTELKNRFFRSATVENLGDEGMVTDSLISIYREIRTFSRNFFGNYPYNIGNASFVDIFCRIDM
jgi:hypothetical protein